MRARLRQMQTLQPLLQTRAGRERAQAALLDAAAAIDAAQHVVQGLAHFCSHNSTKPSVQNVGVSCNPPPACKASKARSLCSVDRARAAMYGVQCMLRWRLARQLVDAGVCAASARVQALPAARTWRRWQLASCGGLT